MTFPWCQFGVGTETPSTPRTRRPCRALPTFVVAETELRGDETEGMISGWFELGEFCTGHAITVCDVPGRSGQRTRAMRPLPITVEVHGKH